MGRPEVPRQPAGVLPEPAAFAHGIALAFASGAVQMAQQYRAERDEARAWVRRLGCLSVVTVALAVAGWLL